MQALKKVTDCYFYLSLIFKLRYERAKVNKGMLKNSSIEGQRNRMQQYNDSKNPLIAPTFTRHIAEGIPRQH